MEQNKTRQINEGIRQITNVNKRVQKRGYCQIIAKYITQILKKGY